MATRPCFSSTHRQRWSCSSDAPSDSRSGSQRPAVSIVPPIMSETPWTLTVAFGAAGATSAPAGAARASTTALNRAIVATCGGRAFIAALGGRLPRARRLLAAWRSSPAGASSPGRGVVALWAAIFSMS